MTADIEYGRMSESGLTLIEILVAVVILTISSLSVVGAIGTLTSSAGLNRLQADVGAVVRSTVEQVKAEPYVPCTLFSSSSFYNVSPVPLPEPNVQAPVILQVQALSPSGGAPVTVFSGGTPSACSPAATETGLQLVEVADNSTQGAANVFEHQWVVKSSNGATSTMAQYAMLVSAGSGAAALSVVSGGTLRVNGSLVIDSNTSGAVSAPAGASLALATAAQPVPWWSNAGTNTCPGTGCPSVTWNTPAPSDPLASLIAPTTPANVGSCTISGLTTTCTPGYYNASTISNTVNPLVFNSGVYVLDNNSHLTLTGGGPVTNTQGGVFFYLLGGSTVTIGPNVSLSAIGSGTWQNILLWQSGPAITISGGSSPTALSGIVYGRTALTTVSAGTSVVTIDSLISNTVTVGSGGTVYVGT